MFHLNINSRSLAKCSSERSKIYGLFDDIQIGSYINLEDCWQVKCVLHDWNIIMDFPEISDMSLVRNISSTYGTVTQPHVMTIQYSDRVKI